MPRQPEPKHLRRFIIFWFTAGILEFPYAVAFLAANPYYLVNRPQMALAMHLLATLTMFFSLPKGEDWFHHERCWPKTFVLWVGFLPLLGWILSGVLYFFYRPPKNLETLFEVEEGEKYNAATERLYFAPQVAPERFARIHQGLDFLPLADIMAGDDINLKRGAVENLYRLGSFEAIALLLAYRSDPNPELRFFVTSALTKLKKELDEELDAAKRQMQKDVYKVSSRIFLAKVYLRYAKTGLLDEFTAKRYREEAVYHLRFALESGYARKEVYWLLFELYRESQNWPEALKILDLLERQDKNEEVKILESKAQLYFKMGKFQDVLEILRSLKSENKLDEQWQGLASSWGVF